MASHDKTPQERIPDRLVPYAEEYHAFLKLEAEVVWLRQEREDYEKAAQALFAELDRLPWDCAPTERVALAALVASPDKPPEPVCPEGYEDCRNPICRTRQRMRGVPGGEEQ